MGKICVKHSKYLITKNSIIRLENEAKKEHKKNACMNSGSTKKFQTGWIFQCNKTEMETITLPQRMKNSVFFLNSALLLTQRFCITFKLFITTSIFFLSYFFLFISSVSIKRISSTYCMQLHWTRTSTRKQRKITWNNECCAFWRLNAN